MVCKFCDGTEKHLIKEFDNWTLYLHKSQYYLGRCKLALKRHIEDITETNQEEREELFILLTKIKKVLIDLFEANHFNYLSAGNGVPHVHIHIIPRYNHEVKFEGEKFNDENWGKNHSPYPRNIEYSEELLNKIKQKILEKL